MVTGRKKRPQALSFRCLIRKPTLADVVSGKTSEICSQKSPMAASGQGILDNCLRLAFSLPGWEDEVVEAHQVSTIIN